MQSQLANTFKQADKEQLNSLRQSLQNGLAKIKNEFLQKPNIAKLFNQHCELIDCLLIGLWSKSEANTNCCLIAVGGYGRGELYPYSDIDLLLLIPDNSESNLALNQDIEHLISLMWDIGLNVGHSVRTLDECISEAQKDVTVQTNLLESRLLAGDQMQYQHFVARTHHFDAPMIFFEAKLKEQQKRHAKFNDTAYNLEPNIKESPGGLRDLHMITWLARTLNLHQQLPSKSARVWKLLTRHQIISAQDAKHINQHERKLQNLRIRLHFLSGRREDRLLFDFQNEIANSLGYINTPRKRASEQLMQSYYRSVKFIELMNEILLKEFQQMLTVSTLKTVDINQDFESRNQLLECKSDSLLQQRPAAIFEAFLLLQKNPQLNGMGAGLVRSLQRAKHLVNQAFRNNPDNKKRFIEILSQPIGVNHTLRAMNRYGILGSYIPAFGRIVGQMQHDLFHVYTVDEHILNVLANLRRFSKPELKHEFPLCSQLFAEFDAPQLLYLSALFHDIAKGRNGDHSNLGKVDAARFCKSHDLNKADSALVSWLVETHLKMSATAQKSDLSDPNVIEGFASLVVNERRLTALYLLTVADIRGTSPMVWNAWKARLLENLYHETKRALSDPAFHAKQIITRRIEEASQKLQRFGISQATYENMWQQFGDNYFVRHETDEIAWQSRLLTPHLNSTTPIVRARLSSYGDGIQVMIYTKDQNDIFARICNFFDRMGYNIVGAKIYTTNHDYALDSFIILDQDNKSVSYSGLLKFIETELTEKLTSMQTLESPLKGRVCRQVKHMPIQAQLTIRDEPDNNQTLLDMVTNDRPGLLATVAQQFLQHDVVLHNAKINTLGNRVEDTFLISAKNGLKLSAVQIQQLQQSLLSSI
jgi:[protein-PII] uridylyltransferase